MADKEYFVVGVDFGTTYSCVAFAHSSTPRDVKIIQEWPGRNDENLPSKIRYSNNTRENKWGFEATAIPKGRSRDVSEILSWFKLLLQHKDGVIPTNSPGAPDTTTPARPFRGRFTKPPELNTSPSKKSAAVIQSLGLTPERVVTDFLKGLQGCIRDVLIKTYGKECVDASKVKYVLTIPAIWSDSAKGQMVNAAQAAGFGLHRTNFTLIGEPEAAAAYTLQVVQPNRLKVGDTFLICDAGGGTVDLITYKIDTLEPELKIKEVVPGTGDLCGSIFLNHAFEKYLRQKLSDRVIDNWKHKAGTMDRWEDSAKFIFAGREHHPDGFDIDAAGLDPYPLDKDDGFGIAEDVITVSADTVEKIFQPIVNRIIDLVRGQVSSVKRKGHDVKAILLVGGFGCSPYLFNRLEAESFLGQNIEIMRPPNSRSAIARGALVKGRDGSFVSERRSRRFYGFNTRSEYNPSSESTYAAGWQEYKTYDSLVGTYFITGKMNWYILKDQVIGGDHWVSSEFWYNLSDDDWTTSASLMVSDEETAPDWNESRVVKDVCSMGIDFNSVDKSTLEVHTGRSGGKYYHVWCKLNMRVLDEVLEFSCTSRDGKTQLGKVTADFSCAR